MRYKHSLAGRPCVSLFACAIVTVSAFWIAGVYPAMAQVQAFPNTPDTQITIHTLRQKAKPDECWAYLAGPAPLPMWTNPADCAKYGTNPPAKPKVNQAYIWGVAESSDSLWFGTFANGNCVTQAGSTPPNPSHPNGAPPAHATDAWACEYYDSPYYPGLYPDARIGDARTPRTYQYNKSTHALVDKTPKASNWVDAVKNPDGIFPLLISMRGIRAAAVYNNVVILAGPNLNPTKGIAFFGWNAATGEFLGGYSVPGYNNIRQFLNLNGILYTAVGTNDAAGKITGGAILRVNPSIVSGCTFNPAIPYPCFLMNGGVSTAPAPPAIVGTLASVAGSITAHNGRIFTVTWPSHDLPGSMATLYMSPVVPVGGLTNANTAQWTTLWRATDYEPDASTAQTYAGGAIASFDGYLWWGTLHIPMMPFQYLTKAYPPANQEEGLQALIGTFRSTVFFRGKDLDTNPQIDLVYGNYRLPVFTPPSGGNPGKWALQVNKTGKKSLWGPSGFGNIWNTYTWSAGVSNNRLWIGTMDWAFMAQQGTAIISAEGSGSLPKELFATAKYGADLFYFTNASKPGFPESTNGVDNPTTFGVRNQVSSSNGNVFLGMANAMNLLTDPADPKKFGGLGGWELNELSPLPAPNTANGTNVTVNLPNGISVTYCSVTNAGTTFSSAVPNPFSLTMKVNPLLVPYDLNGPELPPGIASPPSKVALLWSSASWGQGCSSSTLANVSVPAPSGMTAPRLLQMQWDGTQYVWKDITTSVNLAAGKVYGSVTSDYLGLLGVAQASAPSSGGASNQSPAAADTMAPGVPANLGATAASATQINLTWTASTDNVAVTGYRIFRNGTAVGTTAVTSFSVVGLTPSTTYSFKVLAFDAAANESAQSVAASGTTATAGDTLAPSIPTNLAATVDSAAQIDLTWNASIDNVAVTGYRIFRNGTAIGTTAVTSFAAVGLSPSTRYSFTVLAFDAVPNNSAQSVAVSETTPAALDTEAPSVSITTSRDGVMIAVSANVTDNVGVAGVQFKLDGANLGASDTIAPYAIKLDTRMVSNGPHALAAVARDAEGNQGTSTGVSFTVENQPSTSSYSIPGNGGRMFDATSGNVDQLTVGSITMEHTGGTEPPAGVAIVGLRQDGVLVAEAGIPASAPILSGRILAQIGGPANTGVAFTNPGITAATVTYYFTDSYGVSSSPGSFKLHAGHEFAGFLNQPPFNGAPMEGALTFTSTVPLAAIGIRGFVNERGEFLFTVLPVVPLTGVSSASTESAAIIPLYSTGGGWTTEIVLTNPTDSSLAGTIQFVAPDGSPAPAFVGGLPHTSFPYVLPMRSTVRFVATNSGTTTQTGSLRVVPAASNATPSATAIFSFNDRGTTVSQASVSAPPWSDRYRVYVEKAGGAGAPGSIQSGIAIANTSPGPVTVQLDLTRLGGQRAGYSTLLLPPGGQISRFLDELFPDFPAEFRGILRVSAVTSTTTPLPIVVTGIRGRYNERGDFLLASTPAADENAVHSDVPLVFAHVVNGQGYTTQLILFSDTPEAVSGRLFHKTSEGVLLRETVKPAIVN